MIYKSVILKDLTDVVASRIFWNPSKKKNTSI